MPIELSTPVQFAPGRGQEQEVYEQAKIVGFTADIEPPEDAGTTIRVQYGNTVEEKWVPGKLPIEYVSIQDVEPLFDTEGNEIRAEDLRYSSWVGSVKPTSVDNLLYAEIAIALYTYLLTQEGFEGSIV
jgi:hypothetical protein